VSEIGPGPPSGGDRPQPVRAVDLTADEAGEGQQPVGTPAARARSIGRQRERIRGYIALILVVILSAVVLGALTVGMIVNHDRVEDIKGLLEVILPPIVALTGTAMGFYFGGRDDDSTN
jgi:hypothetical protein